MKISKRVLVLPATIVVIGALSIAGTRPLWPTKPGVFIATSSETIPLFPRALNRYRSVNNKDYWDRPFSCTGSIRIFEGSGWTVIPDFPTTMNHCSDGVFMLRWRSANPDVRITTALGSFDSTVVSPTKTGKCGYVYSNNCEQLMFKFNGTLNGSDANLADLYYEVKFWQAAP